MIAAFSTSSPLASVAIFDAQYACVAFGEDLANRNASAVCLRLFDQLLATHRIERAELSGFVADIGPGSLSGIKVGVTIAKVLGLTFNKPVAGIHSYRLYETNQVISIPVRRGDLCLWDGQALQFASETPAEGTGYAEGVEPKVYPHAKFAQTLLPHAKWLAPEMLVPDYCREPLTSTPKGPIGRWNGA